MKPSLVAGFLVSGLTAKSYITDDIPQVTVSSGADRLTPEEAIRLGEALIKHAKFAQGAKADEKVALADLEIASAEINCLKEALAKEREDLRVSRECRDELREERDTYRKSVENLKADLANMVAFFDRLAIVLDTPVCGAFDVKRQEQLLDKAEGVVAALTRKQGLPPPELAEVLLRRYKNKLVTEPSSTAAMTAALRSLHSDPPPPTVGSVLLGPPGTIAQIPHPAGFYQLRCKEGTGGRGPIFEMRGFGGYGANWTPWSYIDLDAVTALHVCKVLPVSAGDSMAPPTP